MADKADREHVWAGVKVTRDCKRRLEALAGSLGLTQGECVERLVEWGERVASGEAVRMMEPAGEWSWRLASSLPIRHATATLEWRQGHERGEEVVERLQNG